ncbi:ABC transporter permease [Maribellus sediminis]|uniref:ABC transporter permease n=1 Tax=Maribellus sediminis TaxID=2696285 RepID=UPI0014300E99|nr:FtsX-like permease family protein [Maribellus sediminis]
MTRPQFILKSFIHYFKANLLVALGVAISAMVLTGSLVIGDSVRYSLTQATFYRLGETTHLVSVKERYFRQEMAAEMEARQPEIKATPILLLEGIAVADGGQRRANKVQVVGVDSDFSEISNTSVFSELENNEIAISQNLAEKLQVQEGDNLLIRIKKASLIPMNAPFVSAEETTVALRASVKTVLTKEQLGRFNLKNSQTAPFNIFLSIGRLNQLMDFEGKANQILVKSILHNGVILQTVNNCLTPADAGLQVEQIGKSNEVEISTERVFIEEKVAETLQKLPDADPILTYFVNEIAEETTSREPRAASSANHQSPTIPYSFVSSLQGIGENEISLNKWAADDLGANVGDSIVLKYWQIGPLRKLIEKESLFIVREIIPMNSVLCDPDRVPELPGLSDAGHCREWEAGVPINLDAIRDKDEQYWNEYKGTPKAFVSFGKALEMWSNRFGNYTAFRFPAATFSEEKFTEVFKQNITSADLGMMVEPIRANGVQAAQNGTDFSGLFIGLSFFILIAAIILTALLFRFNLENRSTQVGLLAALGFQQKQIRRIYISEGLVTAVFGAVLGVIVSVFYTRLVFRILNTLWFDIVRTNVLEIKIVPLTLVTGFLISVLVSLGAIFISVRKFQQRQIAEIQKSMARKSTKKFNVIYDVLMWISLVAVVIISGLQLTAGKLEPSMFFTSGALLLLGLLLLFRKILRRIAKTVSNEPTFFTLIKANLGRNLSRSLTVVILFALGTFIVVSTGSNKLDLFANAQNKTSGTGGFLYFAETTVPVLFDINDPQKKAEEGIFEKFDVVQFRKVDGDDASCLNLNRIAQPAILGVDPEALADRFSFAVKEKEVEGDPWLALDTDLDDGTITAIADQTVIQWGLGKKVGDVIQYQNALGDTLNLKLIAGTTPSIFQGFVIISNQQFLKNYPSSSGSSVFLVEGDPASEQAIGDELQSVFRDYGWEMENSAKRLVEFYSITNTYLSIFLALGTLGLILGTIGLAVILARTILERRREIAMMQAVGFRNTSIFRILANEYLVLLVTGVLMGFVAAVVATLPAFLSTNSDASFSTVLFVVAAILVNGVIWIAALSRFSLNRTIVIEGLQAD